jgi:hypothetical protein
LLQIPDEAIPENSVRTMGASGFERPSRISSEAITSPGAASLGSCPPQRSSGLSDAETPSAGCAPVAVILPVQLSTRIGKLAQGSSIAAIGTAFHAWVISLMACSRIRMAFQFSRALMIPRSSQ